MRHLAAAIAVASAVIATLGAVKQGGGNAMPSARDRLPQIAVKRVDVANGPLTLNDMETVRSGEAQPGWYGISTLGSDGLLHPFIRCPDGVDWCGEIESVDWSPDGAWLAFGVSSVGVGNPYNGLHLFDPKTGEDRVIAECHPYPGECDWHDIDWSPNGSKLAYVSNGDLVVIDSNGTGRRTLVADPDARSPSWSPDGRRLAFAHEWNGRFAVYLMRADGTHRQLLVDGASAPAWSPDGTSIAYRARCGGVKLVTPDGRDVTPDGRDVTPAAASSCHAIGINGRPVWSPDGTKIAVAGTTTFGTGAPVRGTFVMNADGSGLALVTTKAQGVYMGFDPRPAWRPIPRSR